ncbi:MAG: transglutaminase domain-containing protein [Ruminococcus sp.]|nr:transglutaminase domain-containing protein [Ruminococcus sp.]
MKRLFSLLITLSIIITLCGCSDSSFSGINDTETEDTPDYMAVTQINHCAVEPDDKLHMTDQDEQYYEKLMNAVLNRNNMVQLSIDETKNTYYIDLLKQSPYYFFLSNCTIKDDTIHLSYEYPKTKQDEMLQFIDSAFLEIVNSNCSKEDNTLDKILNVHGAVARYMTYDHQRKTDKQLDSPLFQYPDDEIYKALRNKKSVCYGFAYTLRFALLQLDIDCFCVYGPCHARGEGHMWNIFKYNDKFYTCDSAWDRSDEDYARLYHFGKTDKEREVDTLKRTNFSSTFFEEYGKVECIDETFKIFRNIERYTYINPHTYYCVDFDSNEYVFNTQTLTMK